MTTSTYNGWANYETWNVALYIQNEYSLYQLARRCDSYLEFLNRYLPDLGSATPDGVEWDSVELDETELTEMIQDL